MPYVYGLAQWPDTAEPTAPGYAALRDANCTTVVCNPGVEAELFRNAADNIYRTWLAILSAAWVPLADKDNPYWKGLQAVFGTRHLWRVNGAVAEFGEGKAAHGRIYPSERNADRLVDFVATSPTPRAYNGLFVDEGTRAIPRQHRTKLGLDEALVIAEMNTEHAHYMNRLFSGLRDAVNGGLVIANTAGWTHPSLDAIAVECQDPARGPGGSTIAEARVAAELQMKIGRNTAKSIAIWGGEATPPYAMIEGRWPA